MTLQIDATYSPEDNKLRLYASERLPPELYHRVRDAGFSWAPKQDLFVAPMWTPERAALAEELAGEIGDEGTSREERAEQRAERFGEYSDKRANDSARAAEGVRRLADGIPLGQPILVGHHSERRARKDAERIDNGMRKAVKMWETAEYWDQRAKGALRDALYKERPDVRARRIKRLESELRKVTKNHDRAERIVKAWERIDEPGFLKLKSGEESTPAQRVVYLATVSGSVYEFTLAEFPRAEGASKYEGRRDVADAVKDGTCSADWARAHCAGRMREELERLAAWKDHYTFRLTYERAMMGEAGGIPTDQTKPQKGGAIGGLWAPRGGWAYIQKVNRLSVSVLFVYNPGGRAFSRVVPFDKVRELMTADAVEQARKEGRLSEVLAEGGKVIGFRLAEKAPETKPDNVCPDGPACPSPDCQTERERQGLPVERAPGSVDDIAAMRASIKAGVQVAVSPTLYPTPPDLCRRMVELADIEFNNRILEPSAGTGNIVEAIQARAASSQGVSVTAVELSLQLANGLASRCKGVPVIPGDFLEKEAFELGAPFDRILMNPPFNGGADIRHILHARRMLKPGGRLVGICAGGPRQVEKLQPLCDSWEELPAGTFAAAGTQVNTVLFTMGAAE